MKIIAHGKTHKEIQCRGCGALLSYCRMDLIHKEYITRDVYLIICPECGHEILIKTIDKEENIF